MPTTKDLHNLRVFLCHAKHDKPAVQQLCTQLRNSGVDPWLDSEKLLPGQLWEPAIDKAVKETDVVLVCLSCYSTTEDGFVHREIRLALDVADTKPPEAIYLIPLRLEECDVPERLSRWQWVDLFSPAGYEKLLEALRIRGAALRSAGHRKRGNNEKKRADVPEPVSVPVPTPSLPSFNNPTRAWSKLARIGLWLLIAAGIVSASSVAYLRFASSHRETRHPELNVLRNAKDGMEYTWIPPGEFRMGAVPRDDQAFENEKPQHPVRISHGFWMGRTPVTVGAYNRFVADTNAELPSEQAISKSPEHPIVRISWDDAGAYCKWVGCRLPSEAEWEYAARAGRQDSKYPWGNRISSEYANYNNDPRWKGTSPVGSYPPNAWGLYDMAGNVWEWVEDWFDESYYSTLATDTVMVDPHGPDKPTGFRVMRGGSWDDNPALLRSAYRGTDRPSNRYSITGFRCVCDNGR